MSDPVPPHPPKQKWPKYVLAAVLLFVLICVYWTAQEVKRLQRAKDASKDLRPRISQ